MTTWGPFQETPIPIVFPMVKFSTPTFAGWIDISQHLSNPLFAIWSYPLETHRNAWFSLGSVHLGAHMAVFHEGIPTTLTTPYDGARFGASFNQWRQLWTLHRVVSWAANIIPMQKSSSSSSSVPSVCLRKPPRPLKNALSFHIKIAGKMWIFIQVMLFDRLWSNEMRLYHRAGFNYFQWKNISADLWHFHQISAIYPQLWYWS